VGETRLEYQWKVTHHEGWTGCNIVLRDVNKKDFNVRTLITFIYGGPEEANGTHKGTRLSRMVDTRPGGFEGSGTRGLGWITADDRNCDRVESVGVEGVTEN
jgi:hypothetical protein